MSITEESGHVVITLRDVFNSQREMQAQLAGLMAQMGTFIATNGATHVTQETKAAEVDGRVRELELRMRAQEMRQVVTPKSMWLAIGVLSGLAAAGISIVAIIVK